MLRRTSRLFGVLALAVPVSAAPAHAATVVRVVNEAGVPQAQAQVTMQAALGTSHTARADWNGESSLALSGGETLTLSRGVSPYCGGYTPSVSVRVPSPAPPRLDVTVASITPHRHDPSVTAEEARLVQLVNGERARHGLGPLQDVPSLDRAADTQAAYIEGGFPAAWNNGHCGYGGYGFALRAQDVGYTNPDGGMGEVLAYSTPTIDAATALRLWMASPGHRAVLMGAGYTVAGVALVGRVATMVTGASCGSGAPYSCDNTSGAVVFPPPPPAPPSPPPPPPPPPAFWTPPPPPPPSFWTPPPPPPVIITPPPPPPPPAAAEPPPPPPPPPPPAAEPPPPPPPPPAAAEPPPPPPPAAPPPAAPETGLQIAELATSKAARAGHKFSAVARFTRHVDADSTSLPELLCTARIGGRKPRLLSAGVTGRAATCVWRLPAWARGRTVKGAVRLRDGGAVVARGFTRPVH